MLDAKQESEQAEVRPDKRERDVHAPLEEEKRRQEGERDDPEPSGQLRVLVEGSREGQPEYERGKHGVALRFFREEHEHQQGRDGAFDLRLDHARTVP